VSPRPPSALRRRFLASKGFPLDPFQTAALDALDAGSSVLVAAPTGSGKTVVAEYAVHLALAAGGRVAYTTPLKALSNQKYRDLGAAYGAGNVGLLTGDTAVNGDASVVVMTTEVLRNMIYADAPGLGALRFVVLDEVHYLEDRYRGGVWEEVILGAPASARLVCLSATVANAEELAAWISSVRGPTVPVIERRRPVELRDLFVVGERGAGLLLLPTFVEGRPNPLGLSLDRQAARGAPEVRAGGAGRVHHGARSGSRVRWYRPRRVEVVERLAEEDLLPAIYFVFSRAGCEEAARECVEAGVRLTSAPERRRIRQLVEHHVEGLSDDELSTLGYGRFLASLETGVAPHHAGMVPPFREAVESCFVEALVKVVFATETLALGVNMPARTVVVEQLSKFSGEGHEELTAADYTQLTGRAGRRGIDEVGYAAVLWSPFHRFADVARLAARDPEALRSSFRPTYNMAVNLVRRYDRERAYRLVRSSFAQYLSEGPLDEELDAVLGLLEARGFLDGWRLSPKGEVLAGIYHELDLLVAEALARGLLDGLGPAGLAGLAASFTFEPKGGRERLGAPEPPKLRARLESVLELSSELREEERAARLPVTRELDTGFAALAYAWARGRPLREVLALAEGRRPVRGRRGRGRGRGSPGAMAGGDFVRNAKQLVDLLRQIGVVAPDPRTAAAARAAAERLLRDVVAVSSLVEPPPPAEEGPRTALGTADREIRVPRPAIF
jgi:superfamily II RNA helicase